MKFINKFKKPKVINIKSGINKSTQAPPLVLSLFYYSVKHIDTWEVCCNCVGTLCGFQTAEDSDLGD